MRLVDNGLLVVSPSPHIRSKLTTQRIMLDVILAMLPILVASVVIFGFRALAVVAVCVVSCVFFEWGFEKICKRPNTVADLSAIVTGMLLAFNLPVGIPLWQAAFGSLVAIVVVKQLFGGIGKNFANPAIVGRIVLLLSFAGSMSNFATKNDAISSATPLSMIGASGASMPTTLELFLGKHGGSLGETCALAILIGGAYLLVRRVISWHTPVVMLATVALMTFAFGQSPVEHLLTGGLLLGAFFMATDYTTTPSTKWGKILFGFGCGAITVLIRVFGSYPEGVSFAILFMNILTPYLEQWTRKRPLGGAKK